MTSNKQRKINNKIVAYLWGIAITAILLLFLHTYLTTKTPVQSQENSTSNQPNGQPLTTKNLGLTADEFKNIFNQSAKENKFDMEIKSINVQRGLVQNTFQYMLTDDITLIGNVDGSNDTLQKITVLSTSTEAISSSSTISAVIKLVIYSLNPISSTAQQVKLHTDLGLSAAQTTGDIVIDYDKKRYFYKPSDKLGVMFIVSPITL